MNTAHIRNSIICGVAVLLVAALAACTAVGVNAPQNSDTGASAQEDALPEIVPGELQIVDVRSGATPSTAANGSAYLTILNGTDETVHLVNADTDVADVTELHETINDDGVMRMIHQPDGFVIEPGERLLLEPGGKHVMLMGLVEPLAAGDSYELTLLFEDRDPVTVTVPVVEVSQAAAGHGAMDHGAMDHDATDGDEHGDHGESAEQPAWAVAFEALDVSGLHHIDETVNNTETIEAGFVETVRTFQAGLGEIEWPTELTDVVSELDGVLTELEAALEAEDLSAAGPLATSVHEVAHALEHDVAALLDGDSHGESEHGDHGAGEEDEHSHDAHDDDAGEHDHDTEEESSSE